jgi:20S proteasome alpha/beta subunit
MNNSITEEIRRLQNRIIELEKQQKENEERNRPPPIEYCFDNIQNILREKKIAIQRNKYYISIPLAKYYDQQLVSYLDSIYHILTNMNSRLERIEKTSV